MEILHEIILWGTIFFCLMMGLHKYAVKKNNYKLGYISYKVIIISAIILIPVNIIYIIYNILERI